MPLKTELYLSFLDFVEFFAPSPRNSHGQHWVYALWTQNNPRDVGTCPGHGPRLIAQILSSKSVGLNLPSLTDNVGPIILNLLLARGCGRDVAEQPPSIKDVRTREGGGLPKTERGFKANTVNGRPQKFFKLSN